MEMAINTQYITDTQGIKLAVIPADYYTELLEIAECYEKMEMKEDIKSFNETISEPREYELFDDIVKRIKNNEKE